MSCKIRKFKKSILENYERNSLLEMASDKESYETWLLNHSWELYQHLIFIATLEDCLPDCVEHWAEEIKNFTMPVITTNLKKGCKNLDRAKSIDKWMMDPQMNHDFEDYRIDEFDLALRNEIKKGERMLKNETQASKKFAIKKELEEIKKVLNIVGEFVEPNRERFVQFYDDFKEAATERNPQMLDDAIQRFVETKPMFQED